MTNPGRAGKRTRFSALVMGALMPGLGQIHNGELIKGVCFFSIYQMLSIFGPRVAVFLPDRRLICGMATAIIALTVFYLGTIIEAYRNGRNAKTKNYHLWYFYLAVWLVCMGSINGLSLRYIHNSIVEAYKMADSSMQPSVLRGDFVLVDKTAYERYAPRVNDVAALIDPDRRNDILIRKIAALPGDKLPGPAATGAEFVPLGMVYVAGENRARPGSFIPLRDLLGKARVLYWSSGREGVRWNRIGRIVSPGN